MAHIQILGGPDSGPSLAELRLAARASPACRDGFCKGSSPLGGMWGSLGDPNPLNFMKRDCRNPGGHPPATPSIFAFLTATRAQLVSWDTIQGPCTVETS